MKLSQKIIILMICSFFLMSCSSSPNQDIVAGDSMGSRSLTSAVKNCAGVVKGVNIINDEDQAGRSFEVVSLDILHKTFDPNSEPTHYILDKSSLPKKGKDKNISLSFTTVNSKNEPLNGLTFNGWKAWNKKTKGKYISTAKKNEVKSVRVMVYDPIDQYHRSQSAGKGFSDAKLPSKLIMKVMANGQIICQHDYKLIIHDK